MLNPWENLEKNSNEFILPADKPIINEFNGFISNEEFKIRTEILPFPFVGNVLEAPVVLLMLNPGYDEKEREKGFYEKFKDIFWKQLHHKYGEMDYPYYCLNPDLNSYSDYWPKRFKQITDVTTELEFSKHVCNIQFFPYSSQKMNWDGFNKALKGKYLTSQEYNFVLVKNAMRRNALIIFLRKGSQNRWYKAIEGLQEYKKQYIAKSPFGAYLTEGNFSREIINEIIKTINFKP